MKTVTTHSAKTHLSRFLKDVQRGETIVILHGTEPVAQLTAAKKKRRTRPKVGVCTSEPVRYTKETFSPLTNGDLEEWGL